VDMPSFQQVIYPMRLFGGSDCLGKLGRDLDRLGSSKAVIFCGSSLAQQGSQIDLIKSAMGERCAGVFAGVRAHSPVPAVQAAAEELERLNADAVVAVGAVYCASVSPNLRCVSANVRRTPASVSANVRRKWPSIARRTVYYCAPLQLCRSAHTEAVTQTQSKQKKQRRTRDSLYYRDKL
jgi:hypothetical protein